MESLPFTFNEGLALWLEPIFHCLGKTDLLLVTRQRMRKRFRAQDLCSQVPAEWGAEVSSPWLMLMVTHIPPHLHLLAKAASFSSCFFPPCILVWTAAGVTVPHVLHRGLTLEPDFLMHVCLCKFLRVEPCICLACFFMVTSLCSDTAF